MSTELGSPNTQTSGAVRPMVTPEYANTVTEFRENSGAYFNSREDMLLANLVEHREKKLKFDEASLSSFLEEERVAAELRSMGVRLDSGITPSGSSASSGSGPGVTLAPPGGLPAADLFVKLSTEFEELKGVVRVLKHSLETSAGTAVSSAPKWSREFVGSLKEAPEGGRTVSDAATGVSVYNSDGLLVSKGVVKADNQLAAYALGSLFLYRVTTKLRVGLVSEMGGLQLSAAKIDEFVDLGLNMDAGSVDEDELLSLASLHSFRGAHVLAKNESGRYGIMEQVLKGQFTANALISDSGELDHSVSLNVLSVLAKNFPRTSTDVESAFVVLLVHQWQLLFQTVFGESSRPEAKWNFAFGDFVSTMRSGRNALLPGGFILEAFSKQLGKWFRKVRAEFSINGVHMAFSARSSAIFLLRDLLAQVDLSSQAMQLHECRVKQGLGLRCVLGDSPYPVSGGVKPGNQICLARVCSDLLRWNPCTWLVCPPDCTRRHISALEAVELKTDTKDLIENLFRVSPKTKAELVQRFEEFTAKH